jgi:hypothetical protein
MRTDATGLVEGDRSGGRQVRTEGGWRVARGEGGWRRRGGGVRRMPGNWWRATGVEDDTLGERGSGGGVTRERRATCERIASRGGLTRRSGGKKADEILILLSFFVGVEKNRLTLTIIGHDGSRFFINLDEDKLYTKLSSFDEIYNFVVQTFFI